MLKTCDRQEIWTSQRHPDTTSTTFASSLSLPDVRTRLCIHRIPARITQHHTLHCCTKNL